VPAGQDSGGGSSSDIPCGGSGGDGGTRNVASAAQQTNPVSHATTANAGIRPVRTMSIPPARKKAADCGAPRVDCQLQLTAKDEVA
jgi:hypothetical protein